jgi:SAM-dependent methyltransferase
LEPYLARLRTKKANRIIPKPLRRGRILDIGCGSFPYFLSHTSFREKFAVDQHTPNQAASDIHWYTIDLDSDPKLPFDANYFQVISMLAVVEHLDPSNLVKLLKEANRVLTPGGVLILTTPAAWADVILKWMAKLNLVSAEEINDHKYAYTLPLIGWYFGRAGFEMEKIRFGYFEFRLNMWAVAEK